MGGMGDAASTMIEAAERLAALDGLAAMSIRAVQEAAEQRNKSAVRYHFGGRDGLIEAVLRTRMGPINARRTELLLARDGHGSVRDLVDVLVVPPAEAVLGGPGESYWARFVLQARSDPSVTALVARAAEGDAFRSVSRQLADRLDHLPRTIRARRLRHVIDLTFLTLATAETAGSIDPATATEITTDLVDTVVAVLEAPTSLDVVAATTLPSTTGNHAY